MNDGYTPQERRSPSQIREGSDHEPSDERLRPADGQGANEPAGIQAADRKSSSRRLVLFVVLGVIGLATLGKAIANSCEESWFTLYNRPATLSLSEAQDQGHLLARFAIEPQQVVVDGELFDLGEVWLERAYPPSRFLVWFPSLESPSWCYLCVAPNFRGGTQERGDQAVWFHLRAVYSTPFFLTGTGHKDETGSTFRSISGGFASYGGGDNFHYARVPISLRSLKLVVAKTSVEKKITESVATARLTRID